MSKSPHVKHTAKYREEYNMWSRNKGQTRKCKQLECSIGRVKILNSAPEKQKVNSLMIHSSVETCPHFQTKPWERSISLKFRRCTVCSKARPDPGSNTDHRSAITKSIERRTSTISRQRSRETHPSTHDWWNRSYGQGCKPLQGRRQNVRQVQPYILASCLVDVGSWWSHERRWNRSLRARRRSSRMTSIISTRRFVLLIHVLCFLIFILFSQNI